MSNKGHMFMTVSASRNGVFSDFVFDTDAYEGDTLFLQILQVGNSSNRPTVEFNGDLSYPLAWEAMNVQYHGPVNAHSEAGITTIPPVLGEVWKTALPARYGRIVETNYTGGTDIIALMIGYDKPPGPTIEQGLGNTATPWAVTVLGTQTTVTDRSGTITSGGVAQQLAAANSSRRGFFIQNQSTGDLWFTGQGTAAATQPSIWLPAGSAWEMPPSGISTTAISIFGATTGQAFAAREW